MALLDVLFPPRCAACDAAGAWPLCPACTRDVGVITPPWCRRCGRPWEEPMPSCADCPPDTVDLSRAPFLYEGPLAESIKAMKFAGAHGLAPHLAAAMAEVMPESEAEVTTWVPLSRRRRSRRGFDQAEVLARALGKRLRLPVGGLLVRTRDEPSQARRAGADRRRAALRGAFRLSRRVPARRVLLVDDVLTTGSTAAACAAVLKAGGAEHVTLVTAARSLGGPVPARCRGSPPPGVREYHRSGSRLGLWLPGDVPR